MEFMKACWTAPTPFQVGRHTAEICRLIDEGMDRYARGESTFLVVEVCFRHGKSDMLSRFLPPHWLGRFPDTEVMLTTYGQDLATELSRDARKILSSPQYARVYPGVVLSEESAAADRWGIHGHNGKMNAQGFGGSMTGKGCALGLVDDYLKRRADAESKATRNMVWDSFTNDFMTRRAPVSFIVILASRWHVDDLIGRIHVRMKEDPDFPRFRTVSFPAMDKAYGGDGTLFPERFPLSWYLGQRATLGSYGTAALMQCKPTIHGGNTLLVSPTDEHPDAGIKYYDAGEAPEGLKWVRAWDLASSSKQVVSDDPDYTSGMRMALQEVIARRGDIPVPHLWIDDVVRLRLTAPGRDEKMDETAERDGPSVRVGVETVAGYKDTYERMRQRLRGRYVVEHVNATRDLVARCEDVEPIFEAGNVHVRRASWTAEVVEEWADFPNAPHDDTVASMMAGYDMVKHGVGQQHVFIKAGR